MNKFEAVVLLSPELGTQNLKSELDKFRSLITKKEGKIISEEDWGLRDLSYSINKFKKAFYRYFQLEISGNHIDSIKKEITQSENYMRHLFVKVKNHQELPTKLNHEKK
tara:strand:+ start:94 stop:420 length:327 start_codon:yes stop_codon:yes gene_type:complete